MRARFDSVLTFFWNSPALLFTLTMLFWSGNILAARAAAGHIPPVALAQVRWSLALLLLLPFAIKPLKDDWPEVRRRLPILALLGVLGISAYNTLVYQGLKTTTAVNAALLASIFPMVIAAVGFALYRDRLTLAQAAGIAATTAGAALILSNGDVSVFTELRFVPGDLWVIAAQLAYAAYTVLLRERPAIHPTTFLFTTIFFGQLCLVPFAIHEGMRGEIILFDGRTILTVVYVAIFPALLAFTFFNRGVKLVGSNRAAPYFNLVPMFTVLGALLLLGERLTLAVVAGWVVIIGGIWLAQRKRAVPASAPSPGSANQ